MKKKLVKMSLLIFLLTGLSSRSFFLTDYLTKVINKNQHTIAQFNFALEHNNIAALRLAWQASALHSEQWRELASKLAKTQGDVAFQLALYYQDNPVQSVFWYKTAIRLNYHEAVISLANYYFQQEKLVKARQLLTALPINITQALKRQANILQLNIAISQGKLVEVKQLIDTHAQQLQTTAAGRLLLADLNKYQVLTTDKPKLAPKPVTMSCDKSIQLFATNLRHLKHLENLIIKFKTQGLSRAVCFAPVRYIPINALDCNYEVDQAIRCNELSWQPWASAINTRYVGLMLPKGGANVHLGILYFDVQDSVDVVAHEISHLLGFIDEYPLVAEHVKCRTSQSAPFSQNIAVLKKRYQGKQKTVRMNVLKQLAWAKHIKNTTPILQPVTARHGEQYWQLGTPEAFKGEVGLFHAQTCDNSSSQLNEVFSAFKPVSHRTKLHYFALDFPALYLALLQEKSKKYLMPSFHYNIALAYFQQRPLQQKNISQANYWLEQAASWEDDLARHKKIRQGGF